MTTTAVNELSIYGAAYGPVDVTHKVRHLRQNQQLSVKADPATFDIPDPWYDVLKTLVIAYKYTSQQTVQLAIATDGNTININPPAGDDSDISAANDNENDSGLVIHAAAYGESKVTAKARTLLTTNGEFNQPATDAVWGNASPTNCSKTLVVFYEYQGYLMQDIVKEQDTMHFIASPPLTILKAAYGLADVTDTVRQTVKNAALSIAANDTTFGGDGGWPGNSKSLVVVYQYGEEQPQVRIVQQGSQLQFLYSPASEYNTPANPQTLTIHGAAYGLGDVTTIAQGLVTDNTLNVTAENKVFTDHWFGVVKSLVVVYSYGHNLPQMKVVEEHKQLVIERASSASPNTGIMNTQGLIHDNDLLVLKALNGKYLYANSVWQIVAGEDTITDACKFTVKIPSSLKSGFQLLSSNTKYVRVGSDHIVYANSNTAEGGAIFHAFLNHQGEILFGTGSEKYVRLDSTQNLLKVDAVDYFVATASFDVSFKMSPDHANNIMYQMSNGNFSTSLSSSQSAMARLIWTLTSGFFQALGLGPLISTDQVQTGVFFAVNSNSKAWEAMTQFATQLPLTQENRSDLIIKALNLIGILHTEGLLWAILKTMLKVDFYISTGIALAKILEIVSLPEDKAAQLLKLGFAKWIVQVISAALDYGKACN